MNEPALILGDRPVPRRQRWRNHYPNTVARKNYEDRENYEDDEYGNPISEAARLNDLMAELQINPFPGSCASCVISGWPTPLLEDDEDAKNLLEDMDYWLGEHTNRPQGYANIFLALLTDQQVEGNGALLEKHGFILMCGNIFNYTSSNYVYLKTIEKPGQEKVGKQLLARGAVFKRRKDIKY